MFKEHTVGWLNNRKETGKRRNRGLSFNNMTRKKGSPHHTTEGHCSHGKESSRVEAMSAQRPRVQQSGGYVSRVPESSRMRGYVSRGPESSRLRGYVSPEAQSPAEWRLR
ncbi:unnamed protein product [Gadus morhua 'NCC']